MPDTWLITVHLTLHASDEDDAAKRLDDILGEHPDTLTDLQWEATGLYRLADPD